MSNLTDAIWQLKEENRRLQTELEELMAYDGRSEIVQRLLGALEVLEGEVYELREAKKTASRQLEDEKAMAGKVEDEKKSLAREVGAAALAVEELMEKEKSLSEELARHEKLITEYNQGAETRRQHLLKEQADLTSSFPSLEAHLTRLQHHHQQYLTPQQTLHTTLDALLATATLDTVPLSTYMALKQQCEDLHSHLETAIYTH
eukprot:TRINITY_DN21418_c0_g1_i1.p1 TRINITY_DN21418_c0_g1~~TRINITY_DN21418_c0_g1_i1.p1  ORF type:complete len:204 (+),score=88.51 TRINITY_DN21418_c0_g1_i1:398-1009(+)